MRGIIKVTFGQCIKTMIKTKRHYKIHLHYVKLTQHISFRNINRTLISLIRYYGVKNSGPVKLTHWSRVTHICVGKLTIAGSAPSHYLNQCWNIVNWTLGTNFSEILIEINTFSFKKMHLKISSRRWRPFCLGLNVLNHYWVNVSHMQLHIRFFTTY